jgi:hypothetical protein
MCTLFLRTGFMPWPDFQPRASALHSRVMGILVELDLKR